MKHRNKYININGLARLFLLIHLLLFSGIVGQYAELVDPTDHISLVQSQDGIKTIPVVSFNKAKTIHKECSIILDPKLILEEGLVNRANLYHTFFLLQKDLIYDYKQIIKKTSEGIYLPNSLEFLVFV